MWNYDKILEFPVNIKRPNAKAAQIIISQYGGPDGELGASLRYLSQNFPCPTAGSPVSSMILAPRSWLIWR